ncbi:hypothetical protein LPJ59_000349 [Coemansia sp. RSA 2399]|nr:hypothetical protein LPJ59_000349 [Coemansia sp. RSA 2399]KAJ1908109.1 hypothetical protein LPJ81_000307 [Coemansia sp. IMI 209127]
MSSYTLRYFNIAGFAETSRLLLLASKSKWTEENPEWPQEKANQPFGRLPVLIEKHADGSPDFVISESGTIERYLARSFGFFPSDPKKAVLQEQLRDQITDVTNLFIQVVHGASDKKEKLNEILEKLKEVMPKALKANGSSVDPQGSGLTYIDLYVYSFFKAFMPHCIEKTPELTDTFKSMWTPEVIKLISNVNAEPSLQSRVSEDKKVFTFLA